VWCVINYHIKSFFLQYSVLISQLSERAKSIVRDLDPANELTYLRIKSKKHEILVAPEDDFILIVVQNPPEPLKGE
jgi:dynein light chain roadblock-type